MNNPNLIKQIQEGPLPMTFVVDGKSKVGTDAVWLMMKDRQSAPFPTTLVKYHNYLIHIPAGEESVFYAVLPQDLPENWEELQTQIVRNAEIVEGVFAHVTNPYDFDGNTYRIVNRLPSFDELPTFGFKANDDDALRDAVAEGLAHGEAHSMIPDDAESK